VAEPVKPIVRGAVGPGNIAFWAWEVRIRPPAEAFFAVTLKPFMVLVTEKFQATDHSPVVAFRHLVGRPARLASIANPSTGGSAAAEAVCVGASERTTVAATASHRAVRIRVIDLLLARGQVQQRDDDVVA
jgi:hypothetical protein